jgi:hypothetical protein
MVTSPGFRDHDFQDQSFREQQSRKSIGEGVMFCDGCGSTVQAICWAFCGWRFPR